MAEYVEKTFIRSKPFRLTAVSELSAEDPSFSREGYVFDSWEDIDHAGVTYYDMQEVTLDSKLVNVKALWKRDITAATVTLDENIKSNTQEYGKSWGPIKPTPTVTLDGKTLVKDQDYTVSYINNKGVFYTGGNIIGACVITGIGNYIGAVESQFLLLMRTKRYYDKNVTVYATDTAEETYYFSNLKQLTCIGLSIDGKFVNLSTTDLYDNYMRLSAGTTPKLIAANIIYKPLTSGKSAVCSAVIQQEDTSIRTASNRVTFYLKSGINSQSSYALFNMRYCINDRNPNEITTLSVEINDGTTTTKKSIAYTDSAISIDKITAIDPTVTKETLTLIFLMPDRVLHIKENAFSGCTKLKYAKLSNNIVDIGKNAFYNCDVLATVIIPDTATTIDYTAFYTCGQLTSVTMPKCAPTIYEIFPNSCQFSILQISVCNSVSAINDLMFEGCIRLSSITIPNSITHIGNHAFSGCNNLKSIMLLDSVTHISENAFQKNMKDVTNNISSIGSYAFSYCNSLGKMYIPLSITSIGEWAFWDSNISAYFVDRKLTQINEMANFSWGLPETRCIPA